MKSFFCFLLFCVTGLSAVDPLNNLDYTLTSESWYFFSRDSDIHITQDNRIIGIVKGQWSMTKYADQPAYILFDTHENILAKASAYRKASQRDALFFEISDSANNLIGNLAVFYPPSGRVKRALSGILYSKEGAPLIEDHTPSLSTSVHAYIPGTQQQIADIIADSYLLPYNKMHARILNLPYLAEMNISTELFLMYAVIRKDLINYSLLHANDVYPIYYE